MNPLYSLPRDDSEIFSVDYQQARMRFLQAARQAGAQIQSLIHPLLGPEGEALATDVAWLGSKDAATVLVLLSATHGVEGFSGSAAQLDALNGWQTLPSDVALLMVHAVNPYGFAWLRRVNEEGVDLNRNFINFAEPLPCNMGYDVLADAVVPASLDELSLQQCDLQLQAYLQAHGSVAYEKAVSGGQYHHPHGLFYGGREASWSRLTCEQIMADYRLPERQRVAVLDFHTGLGSFGYGEPICDHPPAYSSGAAGKSVVRRVGDGTSVGQLLIGDQNGAIRLWLDERGG